MQEEQSFNKPQPQQLGLEPWLVDMRLPYPLPERFWAELPMQHQRVHQLIRQGQISSYALDKDHRKLVLTVNAVSEKHVYDTLALLPVSLHAKRIELTQLAFHNSFAVLMPPLSLN